MDVGQSSLLRRPHHLVAPPGHQAVHHIHRIVARPFQHKPGQYHLKDQFVLGSKIRSQSQAIQDTIMMARSISSSFFLTASLINNSNITSRRSCQASKEGRFLDTFVLKLVGLLCLNLRKQEM